MKKVYAYLHTHWDREWYREFEEFRLRLIEVMDDILKKLETKEVETFYFDGQTSAIEDYLEIKPDKKDVITSFIKQKRLFIGPYFCSTDSFLVDAESLIKNLQMGIKYSKDFGCDDFIAYHSDTFGHSAFIPEVVKYFNIPNAVFWRGLGELESEFLFKDLKSTYLIEGYFHDYFSADLSYAKKAEFLKKTLDKIAQYSSDNILLPLGADHLACADNIKEQVKAVNKLLDGYEIILTDPFEYFKAVENNYKKSIKGEFRDTKRNFILPGVYSSRIDLKQQNCRLQWELARKTQPLQAVLSYFNKTKNFQDEVDYIYKQLIKNHAHDSIYGCGVDNVHKENKMRFLKVSEASGAVLNSVARDIKNENELNVINLSNFNLNGALKIKTDKKLDKKYNAQLISKTLGFPLQKVYSINQIPITEDYTEIYEYLIDLKGIDSFSTKTVTKNEIQKESSLKISSTSIENDKIGLDIKNGKVNLTNKTTDETLCDFFKIIDRADIGDSYNFGALKNDMPIYSKISGTKIKEQGKIRSILEINFEISIPFKSTKNGRTKTVKKHSIKMQAILENQNDFIEFKIDWKNKSLNHILQAELNMPESIKKTVSDDLTGYTQRDFDPDYDIYQHIPAPRGVELKLNVAPIQKSLLVQGTGIVTEGLQEYEVFQNNLRLTLLRATGIISNPKNPTRGTPAGPPLPTPDLQMLGENTARFAISFKDNISDLEPVVEKFFETAVIEFSDLKDSTLFTKGNKNILLSTIKLNSEDDLVIRFVNKTEKNQELNFKTELSNNGIFITDAMEKPVEKFSRLIIKENSFLTVLLKKEQ